MVTAPRTWTLRLVYPKLPLSLNDRRYWRVKADIARDLRERVRGLIRAQQIPRLDAIHVEMEFTPSTVRPRDRDNAVATLKPILDGMRDYRPRYSAAVGRTPRRMTDPGWTGIVADDTDEYVTWTPPVIHPANPDPRLTERLIITITERTPE